MPDAGKRVSEVHLRNCGAFVYPPSLLREGEHYVGRGDYTITPDGITVGVLEGSRNPTTIDCRGRLAVIGSPMTIISRTSSLSPQLLALAKRFPYSKFNIVETRAGGKTSSWVIDYVGNRVISRKVDIGEHFVFTEDDLIMMLSKDRDGELFRGGKTTILLGMDKRSVFKSIRKLGAPLLLRISELISKKDSQDKVTIITNGWLTSSDLEVIENISGARLVFCATRSLHKGLGAWLPLHELIERDLGRRVSITPCDARGGYWWLHPLAVTLAVTLVTRYYSWSTAPSFENVLDMVYRDPYETPNDRSIPIYLYDYRPPIRVKNLEQIPPIVGRPLKVFRVQPPLR